jgi:serine/threonine protein kinase
MNGLRINKMQFISQQTARFQDNYTLLKFLGQGKISNANFTFKGGYGEVKICKSKDSGEEKAVKIINKAKMTEKQKRMFQNEIEALRKLDHPNIIKLFEIYEDETSFYLV